MINTLINNSYIDEYIKDYLLKEEYDESDLFNVYELVIDGEYCYDYIDDIMHLVNVSDIEFRNCDVKKFEIDKLCNLTKLTRVCFNDCHFEDADRVNKLEIESLSFINCNIKDYDFVYRQLSLKMLTIVGGYVDFNKINVLNKLEYLRVSGSEIVNANSLSLQVLEQLFIDGTNIVYLDFICNLNKLSLLSISNNQEFTDTEIFESIKDRVNIIYDSMVTIGGDF